MRNCYVVVRVAFSLEHYGSDLEERLNAVAKSLGGTNGSSGAGFGQRDIGYFFKTLVSARKFAVRARRFKNITDVTGEAIV